MPAFGVEAIVPNKVSLPTLKQLDPEVEACTIEYLDLLKKSMRKISYGSHLIKIE